ncbi:hypothetical protein AOQ84DRAFT_378748 [Glonium stellatum]|uniref:ABM domain-containing protein n=1 Tax=Glonium stellatum TaxID=574774 RepID=A0A8E2EWS5_9PEZI|nr:hypothetical protein AOQ84DRAFT_378748 [Glonium stellatum]
MELNGPRFFVVARVVGSPGSFKRWTELLVHLCKVSATEPQGNSYYWGRDLDGEPDTLWGLEGYSHAVGFFMGHPASDVFKTQMAFVDSENLLKQDYDLHHYDLAGGWLTRAGDADPDSKESFVVVHHFWAKDKVLRDALLGWLNVLAKKTLVGPLGEWGVQSCGVLRECNDQRLATLWVRTKTESDFKKYQASGLHQDILANELKSGGHIIARTELHRSKTFNGHIDQLELCNKNDA